MGRGLAAILSTGPAEVGAELRDIAVEHLWPDGRRTPQNAD